MKYISTLFIALYCCACSHSEPRANSSSEKEIIALINQLASTNKEPEYPEEITDDLIMPKKFNYAAQDIVYKAKKELSKLGKSAFPILFKNFDDKRFSEIQSSSIEYTVSVGEICRQIIEANVRLIGMRYKSREGADGKSHGCPNYFSAHYKNDLKEWWRQNKHKNLLQMRTEVLQWRIKEELRIGVTNQTKWFPEYIEKLRKKLEEIQSSEK